MGNNVNNLKVDKIYSDDIQCCPSDVHLDQEYSSNILKRFIKANKQW